MEGTDVLEHHRLILYNNIFDGAGNRIAHADRPTAELACNLLPDGPAPPVSGCRPRPLRTCRGFPCPRSR